MSVDKIEELEARIESLETIIHALISRKRHKDTPPSESNSDIRGTIETLVDTAKKQSLQNLDDLPEAPPPPRPHANSGRPVFTSEYNWLGLISFMCFIAAGLFVIKMGFQRGWFTPIRQLTAAAVLGLGLIATGIRFRHIDRQYFAYLPATGASILYVTAVAGHSLLNVWPAMLSLALLVLISVAIIGLQIFVNHPSFVITAICGTFFSTLFLDVDAHDFFLYYYYIVAGLTFTYSSLYFRSRLSTIVTAYVSILTTALYHGMFLPTQIHAGVSMAVLFFIFVLSTVYFTKKHRAPLTRQAAFAYLPVLLIFYAAEYDILFSLNRHIAPWCAFAFAGTLSVAYHLGKRFTSDQTSHTRHVVNIFVSVVLFHAFYLMLCPSYVQPWLVGAIILGLLITSTTRYNISDYAKEYHPIVLTLAAILLIETLSLLWTAAGFWAPNEFAASIVSASLLWSLILFRRPFVQGLQCEYPFIYGAHLLIVFSFFNWLQNFGSIWVSIGWLGYASVVVLYGFVKQDVSVARSAVFVLLFAAAKALLYDAANAPTVVRIFCLLSTGIVLFGAGLLLRRLSIFAKKTAS